jgi:hypothetical protein
MLIANDPHNPAKDDLKSTPTPTSVFGIATRLRVESARLTATPGLEMDMLSELGATDLAAGTSIGQGLARDFFSNSAVLATKVDAPGSPLSSLVAASPEFSASHGAVVDDIRRVVRDTAAAGVIDYRELAEPKKKVGPPRLGFGGFQALHVYIGSFQGSQVFLNDFSADPSRAVFSADLMYHFFDHFGVDNSDAVLDTHGHGSPGQVALWILQRERHPGHMPYITDVVVNATVIDERF